MGGGGGSLGPQPKPKRGKNSKRKKKKRVGFVLDMTPLVDIAFLLLTFFMFTTTMVTPQIMEMQVPLENTGVEVPASKLFNVIIRADDSLFVYRGLIQESTPEPITLKALRTKCVEENMSQVNELITALKADTSSSYGRLVQVLDVLNLAEGDIVTKMAGQKRERKFTLAPVDPKELEAIKGL